MFGADNPACTGACCVAFPVNTAFATLQEFREKAETADAKRIAAMVVPLTLDEAQGRFRLLVGSELPEGFLRSPQLYTCTYFDGETHRCTDYANRPAMCSEYPYGAACEHCGYRELRIDAKLETEREEARSKYAERYVWDPYAGGYRALPGKELPPGDDGWVVEDGVLKPKPVEGQAWDPERWKWRTVLTPIVSR